MIRALYNSHATPEVYEIIASAAPPEVVLLTLERDSDEERKAKLAEADVVIAAGHKLHRGLIEAAPRLRLVHHQGVGYHDTVDTAALAARGIRLALTPEGTTVGVAEHAILLMLAVYKRLPFADAELRQGRFHVNALRPVSRELQGRTVGYIGMGRIGQATAERLRAFGTEGVYFDEFARLDPEREAALGLRRADGLDALLEAAEIVTLHVPLTAATRHLIDDAALAKMRPGSTLINTARGGLVDEAALKRALVSGHLLGAGLDVFETEPTPANHILAPLPNVVLTPHIAAGTRDALTTKMAALFANVERFWNTGELRNEVPLQGG